MPTKKNKTRKTRSSATKAMSRQRAEGIVELFRNIDQYARHPDVEKLLGYQAAGHLQITIAEIAGYLEDNVISPDGDGMSASDFGSMSRLMRSIADTFDRLNVIPFALPASAVAKKLRSTATQLSR
jgi:hypothetical protein